MEMLERQYQFGDVKPRALFAESRLALQVPKQLASTFEVRFVSFFRTWNTLPNVPRPISLRNSKSRGVSARFVCVVD
jgi:hypothetical protein